MKKKIISSFYLLLFLFACVNIKASHIVGGELTYKYKFTDTKGNNVYDIFLTHIVECPSSTSIPAAKTATVDVLDKNNFLFTQVGLVLDKIIDLPGNISNACIVVPSANCYQKVVYTNTVALPTDVGMFEIEYSTCCRSETINNIEDPACQGIFFSVVIPDPKIRDKYSNPKFKNPTPTYICLNKLWSFDGSAISSNTLTTADSLVYELYEPLNSSGENSSKPTCSPNNGMPINWISPFSFDDMLGSVNKKTDALKIDKFSGKLTAIPNKIGTFLIAWKVKEYTKKSKILLSETMREIHLVVLPCSQSVKSNPIMDKFYCNNTVNFTNIAVSALNPISYTWLFGDGTSTTSSITAHTYTTPGPYTVTAIASVSNNAQCSDTVKRVIRVVDPKIFSTLIPISFTNSINCKNTYTIGISPSSLQPNIIPSYNIKWNWDFGDGSQNSNLKNPIHAYNSGTYTIRSTISIDSSDVNSCKTIQSNTVLIVTTPTSTNCNNNSIIPNFSLSTNSVCVRSNIVVNCLNAFDTEIRQWSIEGTSNSKIIFTKPTSSVTITFTLTGIQTLTLTAYNNAGIPFVVTKTISVIPNPIVSINTIPKFACENTPIYLTANGAETYKWDGLQTTRTVSLIPVQGKFYTVAGTNGGICTSTITTGFNVSPIPTFTLSSSQNSVCTGISFTLNANNNDYNYTWYPINKVGSTVNSIVLKSTTFTVVATGTNSCKNIKTIQIDTYPNNVATPVINPNPACLGDSTFISILNGKLSISTKWEGAFIKTYKDTVFNISVVDKFGCALMLEFNLKIKQDCGLITYTGFSPNGDGLNDFWFIDNIDKFQKNQVYIFNRWGNKIADIVDYDNITKRWDGKSKSNEEVTSGTYFFILLDDKNNVLKKGWIEITN